MSRRLASLVAALVMTAGVTAVTGTPAQAAPDDPYPPTASALTVNRGAVKVGASVRATGRQFSRNERIHLTVLYKPLNWDHYTTVLQNHRVRANGKGKFSVNVRMYLPGTAMIKARGLRSGKSAAAPVRVLLFGKGRDGWQITRAAHTPPAEPTTTPALALAGVTILALTGGTLITRRFSRRRKA